MSIMTMDDAAARDGGESAGTSDPEWIADLIDIMRDGDIDTTVEILGALLRRLQKASKARRALTLVPAPEIRKAMELRAGHARDERLL
jgi:hypothetical protein